MPVLGKNIANQDLDKAPWGMSVQPLTFAKRYNMVESDRQHNVNVAKLNQEKAYRVFAAQMGPRWNGLEGLQATCWPCLQFLPLSHSTIVMGIANF